MPTEKIADQVTDGFHAEVSWRRKPGLDLDDQGALPGHVQIATVNVHSPFEFPDVEHGTSWEAGEKFDGWRVTLDEAGIDRLIKALHKAKNQAFGESMAAKADRAVKTWRSDLAEGADPAAARAKVWATFGYSDEEIARIEDAISPGGPAQRPPADQPAPRYAAGGYISGPSGPAVLADDECILREVTTPADAEPMWTCARGTHAGQRCQTGRYTWAEATAQPQPIRFKTPEVTVESAATAADRLDTDRYRAIRRGDR